MKNKLPKKERLKMPGDRPEKKDLDVFLAKKNKRPVIKNIWLLILVIIALLYDLLIWNTVDSFKTSYPAVTISTAPPDPLREKILSMVKGYPIEKMVLFISKQEPKTAAFLVSVAKKESNWGKHSPKKDGRECYNYWGYRGPENPTRSGYSCFSTPKEAVRIVGNRFSELIAQNIDEPDEMVVWKCGWNCSSHSPISVAKWIKDVGYYYRKLN
jgi:hypothetical protein